MVASIAAVVGKAVDFCANKHPTYEHRVNDPGEYNWCTVEGKSWDVILFAGIAVVVACLSQGPYSSLIVLMAGGGLMGFVYPFNLREIGNGVALWLGIEPYELFFYIFLPPLLLDAALKIDWYVFKKVGLNVVTLAFLVVMGMCGVLIPVMLYVFWLKPQGWAWYDAALLGSMIASTDAVAIVAVLKKSGPPEHLRILLEGESLLNDASSITLFTIFIEFVADAARGHRAEVSVPQIILTVLKQTAWLTLGGFLIGIAFGLCTRAILRRLQRYGATAEQQIALTLACGYLAFYTANAPCKVSGVIAVAVFGLYGAATSKFDISAKLEESGAFDDFWNTFAFVANGIVFFYAGASSVNFLIRSASSLTDAGQAYLVASLWRAPLVWVALNLLRFLVIAVFKPLFALGSAPMDWRDIVLCSVAGLRGSVSLILAQAVVIEVPHANDPTVLLVQSEIVMFTAVFVLLTLLVQAPLLPYVLRWTGLDAVSEEHQKMRQKAAALLLQGTQAAVEDLRDNEDEMLRGVDWDAVRKYVDMSGKLDSFVSPQTCEMKQGRLRHFLAAVCYCCARHRSCPTVPAGDEETGDGLNAAQPDWDDDEGASQDYVDEQIAAEEEGDSFDVEGDLPRTALGVGGGSTSAPPGPPATAEATAGQRTALKFLGGHGDHGHGNTHGGGHGGGHSGNHGDAALQEPLLEAGEEEPPLEAAAAADMRTRICAGMKRFFHDKCIEGLLSNAGLRTLDHRCDAQIDNPHSPLSIWPGLQDELTSNWLQAIIARVVFWLRQTDGRLQRSGWRCLRAVLGMPGFLAVQAGNRLLSKHLLLSSEVAMEYLLALTHSPGVRWLQEHRPHSNLVAEVAEESARVWCFILSLEVEAPDRFRAIQSYRAAMAVLRQQLAFIHTMLHSGLVTETEADLLNEPVDEAMRELIHTGPTWKAPFVIEVLRSLPILKNMPPQFLAVLMQRGRLVMHPSGHRIHECTPGEGIFIVCHGVVKVEVHPMEGVEQTYYLGTGGIFGLFPALTGDSYEGRCVAVAEGHTVGKGPVVFELPAEGVSLVRQRAAAGAPEFVQLEADMFRLAALDVVERLQAPLQAAVRTALGTHIAQQQAKAEVEACAQAAHGRAPSTTGTSVAGSLTPSQCRRRALAKRARGPVWALGGMEEGPLPGSRRRRAESAAAAVEEERVARQAATARHIDRRVQEMYHELRTQLSAARMVQMKPGAQLLHSCSAVILHGAVTLTSATPTFVSVDQDSADRQAAVTNGEEMYIGAPAVIPWMWDAPDEASEGPDETGSTELDRLQVSQEGILVAGPSGAVLVLASEDDQLLQDLLAQLPAGDEEQQGSLKEVPELRPLHIDPSANQLRPPRSMVMTLQDQCIRG